MCSAGSAPGCVVCSFQGENKRPSDVYLYMTYICWYTHPAPPPPYIYIYHILYTISALDCQQHLWCLFLHQRHIHALLGPVCSFAPVTSFFRCTHTHICIYSSLIFYLSLPRFLSTALPDVGFKWPACCSEVFSSMTYSGYMMC